MTQFKMVPVEPTESMTWAAVNAGGWSVEDLEKWQAMLAAAPSPWVSVEERLPDVHKADYLCLFADGHQQVSEWLHDEVQGWVFWYGDPTHWMPLPPPPATQESNE